MRKVLIISAHFPPTNAPDIHRVRQSLAYFQSYNWQPIVLAVQPKYVEASKESLLERSLPKNAIIYKTKAIPQKITRVIGLGNLDFRALLHIFFVGNKIIKNHHIDLIYFSTRSFYLMPLGNIWKKIYIIPFAVDIHDPWFEKDALHKPKEERLPKHIPAYYVNKITENWVMKKVDGLITVSKGIMEDLQKRYPRLKKIPADVIPFGAFKKDFEITPKQAETPWYEAQTIHNSIIIAYIGAFAPYMTNHFKILFKAIKNGQNQNIEEFKRIKVFCIGTNYYATSNQRKKLEELAIETGLKDCVTEIPGRVPYFHSLHLMQKSDILFLPGSKDKQYSSSKVFNYILANKPIITIQHPESDLVKLFCEIEMNNFILEKPNVEISTLVREKIKNIIQAKQTTNSINKTIFENNYSADAMTKKQVSIFNKIISS